MSQMTERAIENFCSMCSFPVAVNFSDIGREMEEVGFLVTVFDTATVVLPPVCRCTFLVVGTVGVLLVCVAALIHKVILPLLDLAHRRTCRLRHNKWPHKSNSHVRPIIREFDEGTANRWSLNVTSDGRQRWMFDAPSLAIPTKKGSKSNSKVSPSEFVRQYHLGLTSGANTATHPKPKARSSAQKALEDGSDFLAQLQSPESGHWSNDYSGPMFLLPGLIITKHICYHGDFEKMFAANGDQERKEMLRYMVNLQNEDGGYGVHTEGHSTMMGTTLNYVGMRLLGEHPNSAPCKKARDWIRSRGGAQSTPTWAKVWLACCGLYSWKGINPVPPEMWLLPDWCPLAMGRLWCHSRIVTLPFGYLYGTKFTANDCKIYEELRSELYVQEYSKINWPKQRDNIFKDDIYVPKSIVFVLANYALRAWEALPFKASYRKKALKLSYEHMVYDDEVTNYICLGPVNKCLNMLICWSKEGSGTHSRFEKHVDRLQDYMWLGPEGLRMNGYNGSQLWDTSFAVQALFADGQQMHRLNDTVIKGHRYVDVAQVTDDPPEREKYYHNRTKGCWNFSTRAQQWQVSDCSAEGLRVVLMCRAEQGAANGGLDEIPAFPTQRIFDGVDEILHLRTQGDYADGGWASYEPPRGPHYLETLNCADVFKDIMIDYSYAECSSSCIHTLCLFRNQFPQYKRREIDRAIREGVACVKGKQRADGSWYGSWAVCFTYGAWLSTEALHLAGEPQHSPTFAKCCQFLLSKQRADGGWSEGISGCITQEYREVDDDDETKKSQVVCTCWAVMSLIVAGGFGDRHREEIDLGVKFIMSRQLPDGDWPQERITGVFNGACGINYPGYKNSMTVWCLGKYQAMLKKLKHNK